MRLRLGLLRDAKNIEKQAAKEAVDAAAKKHKHTSITTVKTEAQAMAEAKSATSAAKEKHNTPQIQKSTSKPKIRPLSEAKAIESGATFISEAFLFGVAGSLIFFEAWRSRRKETNRREDVADRLAELEESESAARKALVELEKEVLALRAQHQKPENKNKVQKRILPKEIWAVPDARTEDEATMHESWLSGIARSIFHKPSSQELGVERDSPGPAEKVLAASDAALAAKHRQAAFSAASNSEEKNTATTRSV